MDENNPQFEVMMTRAEMQVMVDHFSCELVRWSMEEPDKIEHAHDALVYWGELLKENS